MTLTAFLLARIAEDEDAAKSAQDHEGWSVGGLRYSPDADAVVMLSQSEVIVAKTDEPVAEHIARHDPARVLAECEAKRRIVTGTSESHVPFVLALREGTRLGLTGSVLLAYAGPAEPSGCEGEEHNEGMRDAEVLLTLAGIYADHPDYRQEWKS